MLVGVEQEENLGIRYIAAYLRSIGIPAEILSYNPGSEEEIYQAIRRKRPKVVGFSLIFQSMIDDFRILIDYLRNREITAHFTMGGHFPTLACERTLTFIPGLDSVTRHEGELTIRDIYQHWENPKCWQRMPGLAYIREGKVVKNPPRHLIENLDSLPFPVRNSPIATTRDIGIVSLITSRGCFYNCSFCSIQKFYRGAPGPKRRTRSPENVVREMDELHRGENVRIFIFKDDDIGMKNRGQREWLNSFCMLLEQGGLGKSILWRISSRIDEIDEDVLGRLSETGLKIIYLGIESGNEAGLTTCNKHYHVPDILSSLDIIRKAGLHYEYGYMLLDPDSTFSSIKENLAFLSRITQDGLNQVQFTKMLPYTGTDIEQRLIQHGRLKGSVTYPEYRYLDPRIDLFDHFVTRSFNSTFGDRGLTTLLKLLNFDSIILARFYEDTFDTQKYAQIIRDYTKENNELVLSILTKAINFIEVAEYCTVLGNSDVLSNLMRYQHNRERELINGLTQAVSGFFPSLE